MYMDLSSEAFCRYGKESKCLKEFHFPQSMNVSILFFVVNVISNVLPDQQADRLNAESHQTLQLSSKASHFKASFCSHLPL